MMSEHPKNYLALRYRSKRRILNFALALRGRSTGWGRGSRSGKPRRWFVGHRRGWAYHRGIEVVWKSGGRVPGLLDERMLFAYEWGASPKPAGGAR